MTLLQQHRPPPYAGEAPARRFHDVDADTERLFATLRDPVHPWQQRQQARERIVLLHLSRASGLARRFASRGEPMDDLVQVASYALVKAVDGYDPGRGVPFTTYATPTILGELKRHFRDHGWDMRVPRRMQEGHLALNRARAELAQRLQRAPTPAELAQRLQIGEQELHEVVAAGAAYDTDSLNQPMNLEEDSGERQDLLGECDPELDQSCDRIALQDALRRLPQRERDIVIWYFYGNQTQQQIAKRTGISQMHVSRLLAQTLALLRRSLLGEQEPARPPKTDLKAVTKHSEQGAGVTVRKGSNAAAFHTSPANVPADRAIPRRLRTTGLPPCRPTTTRTALNLPEEDRLDRSWPAAGLRPLMTGRPADENCDRSDTVNAPTATVTNRMMVRPPTPTPPPARTAPHRQLPASASVADLDRARGMTCGRGERRVMRLFRLWGARHRSRPCPHLHHGGTPPVPAVPASRGECSDTPAATHDRPRPAWLATAPIYRTAQPAEPP